MQHEHVLHELAEGFNMPLIGNDFISSLCKSLLKILDVEYLCISKFVKGGKCVETIAYCSREGLRPNITYDAANTPCEKVAEKCSFCHFASGVQQLFPNSEMLEELKVDSYAAAPIFDSSGVAIGVIAALNTKPMRNPVYIQNLFMVVAKRVELEIERLINEEKLRHNEAQLNDAQQIANVGSFEWDMETDKLCWSDQLFRIYGYEPGEIPIGFDVYLSHIHPQYRQKTKDQIDNAIKNNEFYDLEYIIVDKAGKQKILHSIGKVIAEDGKPRRIRGVCHDVTGLKRAEYELKQLNAELEERVRKRTAGLERSLAREKLIREISGFTISDSEKSQQMLQQVATKTGAFLEVDGLQIISINNELQLEFRPEGEYYRTQKTQYQHLWQALTSSLKIKRFHSKNVRLLLDTVDDLPQAARQQMPKDIQALLVFEFFQSNKPYGMLLAYHCRHRNWKSEELQFLEEILNLLGSALFKADILQKKKKVIEDYLATQNQLKLITDGIPAFISYLDKNLDYQYVNKFYTEFFKIEAKNIIGKKVTEVLHKKTFHKSMLNYRKALEGKKLQFENVVYDKDGEKHEIEVQFIPDVQDNTVKGLIVLGILITDRKKIERKLKESEERLRLALDSSLLGAWDFDLVAPKFIWDKRCKQMFGLPANARVDYDLFLKGLHPEERERIDKKVKEALRPGNSGIFDEEFRAIGFLDKQERWIKSTGRVLFKNDRPYRFIGIAQDVTRSKIAEAKLREIQYKLEHKNKTLETMQHVGRIISGELEHKKVVQTITDAATALIGAEFGAFINNANEEKQETYHLITLSGKSFSAFDSFPIPKDAEIFAATFKGEKIVRYNDASRETSFAQNNPYLRSYLAVPVFSKKNKVLGGLFFGHSDPDVFTEESEKILEGIAPQAAIALNNAELFDESQLAKQQAEQQRNLLYNIFNHAPSFISLCKGRDFIFEFVNKEYDKYFPKEKLLGQSLRQYILELKQQRFVRILDNVFRTGETYNGKEVPVEITENGKRKTLYFDFIVQALKDKKGKTEGVISYATDISEQVYARKTIEEFMSVASHELKTPLTTVMAYSELLEEQLNAPADGKHAGYISKMNFNLNKLNSLISDLLDVSRIKSGKMLFKKEKIDFDKFIIESLENIKYTAKSHKIVLSGKSKAFVLGDKERLDQVVANIVSNAVKYSPNAKKVSVKVKRENEEKVKISFIDYGMGIPKEKMEHLFQRFYRIEEKSTSGLGIGLYISKDIVEKHSGKIFVQSTPGKGTTFHILLPIAEN